MKEKKSKSNSKKNSKGNSAKKDTPELEDEDQDGFVPNLPEIKGDEDLDYNPHHKMNKEEFEDVYQQSAEFTTGQMEENKKTVKQRMQEKIEQKMTAKQRAKLEQLK